MEIGKKQFNQKTKYETLLIALFSNFSGICTPE